MAHPIPKELRGEERLFSIPVVNIHFNKKGIYYNGTATLLAYFIKKITNVWVFAGLFVILNLIAYPMAHMRISENKFEGGNLTLDKYFIRKWKYKYRNMIVYIRRRGIK